MKALGYRIGTSPHEPLFRFGLSAFHPQPQINTSSVIFLPSITPPICQFAVILSSKCHYMKLNWVIPLLHSTLYNVLICQAKSSSIVAHVLEIE